MNALEKQMTALLREMKEEFDLTGVKGEFEAEGARLEELMRLKEISAAAGVNLTIKIGGCEAITDMRLARSVGADELVAPMIESSFAIKKYLNAAALVYSEQERKDIRLLINVETIDGVRNFENMCQMKEARKLSGLDIGRVDMAASMGFLPEGCNSNQVFEACLAICKKWKSLFPEKSCTLGGLLNRQSILFLERIPRELSVGCESKKIIFGAGAMERGKLSRAFSRAIQFEYLWYQNCMENYDCLRKKNWAYFEALSGYQETLAE